MSAEKQQTSLSATEGIRPIVEDRGHSADLEKDAISRDAQAGVRAIEAAQLVWPKSHLIAAYAFIWLIYFVTSLQEVCARAYSPFVTSTFSSHSLTPVVYIVSNILGGVSKLPLAKILDIWGRPQGMALMLVLWTVGFVIMAACNNVTQYAVAYVFSTVGAQGISYCITVFVSDTSSLKNRGLMLAYATSPYIVTTWAGGPIADRFLMGGPGWRWGTGMWAIVTPVVVSPLILIFIWNQHRAEKMGLIQPRKFGKISFARVKEAVIQMDLLGILILGVGLSMFLVPIAIYTYQEDKWRSPLIICLLIFGGLLVAGFVAYEKWLAPVNFVPIHLLRHPNVLLAGCMLTLIFASGMIWGSFFSSMCMVAWNTTVTEATYISNIYRTGMCFASIPLGWAIRKTRRFKWVAVYYSLPLMLLGIGLMIEFRRPDVNIGYIVMTQIFASFAAGPLVVASELAMMSQVTHNQMAAILAILDLFGSVGSAVGSTVASAVWTNVFPGALRDRLPDLPATQITSIAGSMYTQLGYRTGTPTRLGISWAYHDAQQVLLIISVVLTGCGWIMSWFWKNTKLTDKQSQGLVG
ncbi:hypothetical protein QBC40DRAFT_283374 [Triangularia verruculosa]|uniref:Major facilitator superfamily (MFS) profile domain-containing protein n=1 Tax=Triangularia verruculosa TaxID=2587418 RepID=A0AAN6XDM5_9PEZI|nr:hypothetical protein QBC40DRAFT_283374 [Triangularia verruculosa]